MEIISDFDNLFKKTGIPRMNPTRGSEDIGSSEDTGVYTVSDSKFWQVFYGVEMPPPCGYFRVNYSQYVYLH